MLELAGARDEVTHSRFRVRGQVGLSPGWRGTSSRAIGWFGSGGSRLQMANHEIKDLSAAVSRSQQPLVSGSGRKNGHLTVLSSGAPASGYYALFA